MTNVVEAINELIKGVNVAFTRNTYTMEEVHHLYDAIKFIKGTIENQQTQATPAQIETPIVTITEDENSI